MNKQATLSAIMAEQDVRTDDRVPNDADQPLAHGVADWIRDRILRGDLAPGARIKQEAIAKECRTSRIPVRDALVRLNHEGLVTLTSHAGARVARLDRQELSEIYLLRECLEPFALAESVPHLTRELEKTLGQLVVEMEDHADPDDPSRWIEADARFHLASYSAAPLPEFLSRIDSLWNRTQQYRRAYMRVSQSFDLAHLEHRLLLEAIERRNAADAQTISKMHIRRTRLALHRHAEQFDWT